MQAKPELPAPTIATRRTMTEHFHEESRQLSEMLYAWKQNQKIMGKILHNFTIHWSF